MSNVDIARALRDKNYFNSLSDEEKALVRTADPIGEVALTDEDLEEVAGGATGTGSSCTCIETSTGTGDGSCTCCESKDAT